jgi:integrase
MASANWDAKQSTWILTFRPAPGADRRRKRLTRLESQQLDKGAADRLARMIEDAFNELAAHGPRPELLALLRRHGVLGERDAVRLSCLSSAAEETARVVGPSLRDAALASQLARREADRSPADYRRHLRELEEFIEASGVALASDLRAHHVEAWVATLRERGLAWDSRRHRLLYLRAACAQAARWGFADALVGLRLDAPDDAEPQRAASLLEIREAIAKAREASPRLAVAVIVMGAMGLRPSEALRLKCIDCYATDEGLALRVGARERKTRASRRDLPVAEAWRGDFAAVLGEPDAALIASERGGHLCKWAFGRMVSALLPEDLPAKALRKGFASVAGWDVGLQPWEIDAFLGRALSGLAAVSDRAYVARANVARLRPAAEAMARALMGQ